MTISRLKTQHARPSALAGGVQGVSLRWLHPPGASAYRGLVLSGVNIFADRWNIALADKLADAATGHLRRSQELARVAMKVRAGER